MMISTSKRAIFLAGIKKASTSIEETFASQFEIRVSETHIGKHMTYKTLLQGFAWLFRAEPIDRFFVFGVMRDPVDWILSLYNSHNQGKFSNVPSLTTRNMSFDDFIMVWGRHNSWEVRPQYKMFVGDDDRIMVDFLIDFKFIQDNIDEIGSYVNLDKRKLRHDNISPQVFSRLDLESRHMQWISTKYSKDFEIYNSHVGRLLRV